jgi:chromosome segregation ATPase
MVNQFRDEVVGSNIHIESQIAGLDAELAKYREGLERDLMERNLRVEELTKLREELEKRLTEKETQVRELLVQKRVAEARLSDQEKTIK